MRRQRGCNIVFVKLVQVAFGQVVGMMCFYNSRVFENLCVSNQQQLIHVQCEIFRTGKTHEFANGCIVPRKSEAAEVHRLFVYVPPMRSENRAYRVTGKYFRVFFAVAIIKLVGESYDGVGTTAWGAIFKAVQAGPPQSGLTGKNRNTVTAESFLDPFAVEQHGLCRTGA